MRYKKLYPAVICFCVFLAATGLWKIIVTEDALITDYVKIAGVSAALVNSALVTLVSLLLLYLSKEPPNGFTLVELGLMAGFSLFGKNIVNIWPIIAGTFLYAKARREPFGKYVSVSLLATALAPVVSYVALDNGFGNLWWGIAVGLLIGFVLPPLSAYTYKIQNGMNLYNMGFACGLLAMILVPVMSSMGANPTRLFFQRPPGVGRLGGVPPPAAHHRPGSQRLPSHVWACPGAHQHGGQRAHRHGLHPRHRRRSQRPNPGRHSHHHGLLRLR